MDLYPAMFRMRRFGKCSIPLLDVALQGKSKLAAFTTKSVILYKASNMNAL